MDRKPDIILLALARWDGPYSSTAFSLAKELSRQSRVFYVDNPFTLKEVVRRFWAKPVQGRLAPLFFGQVIEKQISPQLPNLINVRPAIVLPINFLPPGTIYDKLSSFNDFIVRRVIKAVIRKHNLKDYILINSFNPFYLRDVAALSPALSVYHCVDNIAESKYIQKHGSYLERQTFRNYDLTITTSQNLLLKASRYSRSAFCLPNAADFNHFNTALSQTFEVPSELRGTERKTIIGYVGNICLRIDYALLKQLSASNPDKIILLVGPITDQGFYRYGLHKANNIITTGKKSFAELPQYLHYMDCTVIPFKCNELTKNIYPLKLNEYLAAGKPVVSTAFSPDLEGFGDAIKIADSIQGFVWEVNEEIESDNETKRSRRVFLSQKNSWSARVEDFWFRVLPLAQKEKERPYATQN